MYSSSTWDKLDTPTRAALRRMTQPEGWLIEDIRLAESSYRGLEEFRVTIASHKKTPVGWIGGLISFSPRGYWYDTGLGVYVKRDYRGKGVARELLKRWVGNFRRKYGDDVRLYACPTTDAGRRLYARYPWIEIVPPVYTGREKRKK